MRYRIIFHCDFTLESRMRSYSRHLIDNLRPYYRKSKVPSYESMNIKWGSWINQLSYSLPIPTTRNVKFCCNVTFESQIRPCSRHQFKNLRPYSRESIVSATTYQNFREIAPEISKIRHKEQGHVSSLFEEKKLP